MDISIACSARLQTTELGPGETAAARPILALPPDQSRAGGVVVDRRGGSALSSVVGVG
jgi:hypothetical protein